MNGPGGPILGRYTPPQYGSSELVTVRLLGMPIRLFLRARQHHDDLMRELTLMAFRENMPDHHPLAPDLHRLVDILGRRFGGASARGDAERDAAIDRGDATVDLVYQVPRSIGVELTALSELMDAADAFCRSGQLLTLPREPAVAAFGLWYNTEFLEQLKGRLPTPWSGPLE